MRPIFPLLIAGLALTACGSVFGHDDQGEAGEGGASRTFSVGTFDRVSLDGPDDVVVTKGAPSVRAEGGDKALEKLKIEVVDGQLRVGRVPGSGATVVNPLNWNGKGRAKVFVTMPAIRAADLSGAGRFTVEGGAAPQFEGSISGAGALIVKGLAAETAAFDVSGAGSLTLAGAARTLRLSMSGAGAVKAEELTAGDLTVAMSGVGGIKARATGKVTGDISGVGSVQVTGTTDCHVDKSGVGSIKCGL